VPIAIADQLVKVAQKVDEGEVNLETVLTKEDRQELSKSP
jgi:hypothetical protein